jgi:thiamine transport system permease protein
VPRSPRRPLFRWVCTLLTTGVVALFVGWPTVRILIEGFDGEAAKTVLGSARFLRIIAFTLIQATLSTIATLVLGLPAAWLIGTRSFRGRRFLTSLWSSVFTLPTVVVGSAFLALLPSGWNRSLASIVCAHVFFNVGMTARVIGEAWGRLDDRVDDAAATLGASPLHVNRMILVGPLRSTVLSVSGLVMALSLTSFGVILMLGGPTRSTTETEIWRQATQQLALGKAAILALIQLTLVLTVLIWTSTIAGRAGQGASYATGSQRTHRDRRLQPNERSIAGIICVLMTLVVVAPLATLIRRSLSGFGNGLSLSAYRTLTTIRPGNGLVTAPASALGASIKAGSIAALVATVLMTMSVAGSRGRLSAFIAAAPLAVSGAILGFGALLGFARPPLAWRSTWWIVPVMQGLVALPYAVRVLRPAVDELDPRLAEASATLGANPASLWIRVTAPLLVRPFVSAVCLAAAVALGEFGVTSFLVRPKQETLPVAIATLSSRPGAILQSQAAALAVILGTLTVVLVTIATASRPERIARQPR